MDYICPKCNHRTMWKDCPLCGHKTTWHSTWERECSYCNEIFTVNDEKPYDFVGFEKNSISPEKDNKKELKEMTKQMPSFKCGCNKPILAVKTFINPISFEIEIKQYYCDNCGTGLPTEIKTPEDLIKYLNVPDEEAVNTLQWKSVKRSYTCPFCGENMDFNFATMEHKICCEKMKEKLTPLIHSMMSKRRNIKVSFMESMQINDEKFHRLILEIGKD